MTTTPGATSQMARMVSRLTAVPVGLFGLVISTTSGRASSTAAAAASGSMVKSSRRGTVHHSLCVAGVLGVHRVRRRERQHPPTGSGERQQHVQHHLVAAIGSPDLLGTQPVTEIAGRSPRSASASRSG